MEEAGASAAEKGGAAPSQTDSRFLRSNASSPSLEEDACARENCTLWVSASARTYDCLARKALAASPLKGGAAIGGRPSLHFGGQKQQRQRAPSFDVAFPSHALCLHSAASKSFHSELESPAIQQQRRRLPPARLLAETLAGVETSEEEGSSGTASAELRPSFLRQDGTLNLRHKCFREHYLHLLLNDRFHAFLELKWAQLVAVIFVAVCAAAAVLAGLLYLATGGDCQGCLGKCSSSLDFYFFAAETMLGIGYGSPRFPSCTAASALVLPFSVCGLLLNSLVLGVVFQKFSAANKRKWAIAFSEKLVVQTQFKRSPTLQRQDSSSVETPHKLLMEHKENTVSTDVATCGAKATGLLEPLLSSNDATETAVVLSEARRGDDGGSLGGEERDANQEEEEEEETGGSGFFEWRHRYVSRGGRSGAWEGPPGEPRQCLALSFRFVNITATSFFKPRLSLYLIIHRRDGLSIRQFSAFHTDSPLEFLALPITVTVLSTDVDSPLRDVTPEALRRSPHSYELLVLLSFTDNRTSKTVEVAKSWRLSSAVWNESFVPLVRPSGPFSSRPFEVDVDRLSLTKPSAKTPAAAATR